MSTLWSETSQCFQNRSLTRRFRALLLPHFKRENISLHVYAATLVFVAARFQTRGVSDDDVFRVLPPSLARLLAAMPLTVARLSPSELRREGEDLAPIKRVRSDRPTSLRAVCLSVRGETFNH